MNDPLNATRRAEARKLLSEAAKLLETEGLAASVIWRLIDAAGLVYETAPTMQRNTGMCGIGRPTARGFQLTGIK